MATPHWPRLVALLLVVASTTTCSPTAPTPVVHNFAFDAGISNPGSPDAATRSPPAGHHEGGLACTSVLADATCGSALIGAPDAATAVIETRPTAGKLALPFGVTIASTSTDASAGITSVNITNNVGRIVANGEVFDAVVYAQSLWPGPTQNPEQDGGADNVLYEALAVASDSWLAVFLYCAGGSLSFVDYESTNNSVVPFTAEPLQGTCNVSDVATTSTVDLPATTMAYPRPVGGFCVGGPGLSYDGSGPGSITLADTQYQLFPFASVDCTEECGSPGWWELHSLYWNSTTRSAGFGIFYSPRTARPVTVDKGHLGPYLGDM